MIFKFYFWLILFSVNLLNSRVLIPDGNLESEGLLINDKHRKYYKVSKKMNRYSVQGPSKISIFARKAVPHKDIKKQKYKIVLIENGISKEIYFNEKINTNVSSFSHPRHNYTSAAKYEISFPDGDHSFLIGLDGFFPDPILVRVVEHKNN